MKYFIYIINCLLVVLIPVAFIMSPYPKKDVSVISTTVSVKQMNTYDFKLNKKENTKTVNDTEEDDLEEVAKTEDVKVNVSKREVSNNLNQVQKSEDVFNNNVDNVNNNLSSNTDVLDTYTGKMSGYGPNCKGCSGYLSNGRYVGNGDIYYNDSKYGRVRILAGDRSIKFGTIVRIKNSKVGNFTGIVMDRGGSIGFGKTFLFDLLYPSEEDAIKDTVSYNVTFEILRYGY